MTIPPEIKFIQMTLIIASNESTHRCTDVLFSYNDTQLVSFSSIPCLGKTCWINKWPTRKGLTLGTPVAIIDINLSENIIVYKKYEVINDRNKFDISISRFKTLLHSMKHSNCWDLDVQHEDLIELLLHEDMITEKMILKMLEKINPIQHKQISLWQD